MKRVFKFEMGIIQVVDEFVDDGAEERFERNHFFSHGRSHPHGDDRMSCCLFIFIQTMQFPPRMRWPLAQDLDLDVGNFTNLTQSRNKFLTGLCGLGPVSRFQGPLEGCRTRRELFWVSKPNGTNSITGIVDFLLREGELLIVRILQTGTS